MRTSPARSARSCSRARDASRCAGCRWPTAASPSSKLPHSTASTAGSARDFADRGVRRDIAKLLLGIDKKDTLDRRRAPPVFRGAGADRVGAGGKLFPFEYAAAPGGGLPRRAHRAIEDARTWSMIDQPDRRPRSSGGFVRQTALAQCRRRRRRASPRAACQPGRCPASGSKPLVRELGRRAAGDERAHVVNRPQQSQRWGDLEVGRVGLSPPSTPSAIQPSILSRWPGRSCMSCRVGVALAVFMRISMRVINGCDGREDGPGSGSLLPFLEAGIARGALPSASARARGARGAVGPRRPSCSASRTALAQPDRRAARGLGNALLERGEDGPRALDLRPVIELDGGNGAATEAQLA